VDELDFTGRKESGSIPINGVTGHDWFEDAARTARRDTVAQALIEAASATRHRASIPVVVLAAATEQIAARVQAMRPPAPRPSGWRIAALLTLLVITAASTLMGGHDTERLFEFAKHAYLAVRYSR
jgi:hypothetical protein